MNLNTGIQLASDDDVLNACEDGVVGWECAETVELSTPEAELSAAAREQRAVIFLMLNQGMDKRAAERKYKELLPDSERKIPYLSERIEALHDDGLITDVQLDEYRETNKVTPEIEALLCGLDPKEASRYARIYRINYKNRSPQQKANFLKLRGKMRGLTMEEADEYSATLNSSNGISEYIKSRMCGLTSEMAQKLDELTEKSADGEITPDENHELKALTNLRYSLGRDDVNTEKWLAIKEFGIEKYFEYILLRTQEGLDLSVLCTLDSDVDLVSDDSESLAARTFAEEAREELQEIAKSNPNVRGMLELRTELTREPLLRRFANSFNAPDYTSFFARMGAMK